MASRLALVSCLAQFDGPWTLAKGNESKLEIFGLGHGSLVRLEMETPDGRETIEHFQSGIYPWPNFSVLKYRVNKICTSDAVASPTTVRILLNGRH